MPNSCPPLNTPTPTPTPHYTQALGLMAIDVTDHFGEGGGAVDGDGELGDDATRLQGSKVRVRFMVRSKVRVGVGS